MPESTEAEYDFAELAAKEPTDKMRWYTEWLEEVFGLKFNLKQVSLAVTHYPKFQASDFNKQKTEEKRAARATGDGASETPAETAPKRGRGRPAGSGAKPGAKPAGATKPATTGRRGRKPASATADAPF